MTDPGILFLGMGSRTAFSAGRLGLRLSVRVCARGKVYNQILSLNGQQEWIKPDIRILVAFSVSAPRQYGDVELSRIADAQKQAALLATTGLPWDRVILAHRMFVINKAAFGWIGRFPTQGTSEKFFSSLSNSFRSSQFAARALRKLLYGGAVLLNTTVLTQAWKRLRTDRRQGFEDSWHSHAHTTLGLLRRILKKLGS